MALDHSLQQKETQMMVLSEFELNLDKLVDAHRMLLEAETAFKAGKHATRRARNARLNELHHQIACLQDTFLPQDASVPTLYKWLLNTAQDRPLTPVEYTLVERFHWVKRILVAVLSVVSPLFMVMYVHDIRALQKSAHDACLARLAELETERDTLMVHLEKETLSWEDQKRLDRIHGAKRFYRHVRAQHHALAVKYHTLFSEEHEGTLFPDDLSGEAREELAHAMAVLPSSTLHQ